MYFGTLGNLLWIIGLHFVHVKKGCDFQIGVIEFSVLLAAISFSASVFQVVRMLDKRFRFKAERERMLRELEQLRAELETAQRASQAFRSYRTSTEPFIAQLKRQNEAYKRMLTVIRADGQMPQDAGAMSGSHIDQNSP